MQEKTSRAVTFAGRWAQMNHQMFWLDVALVPLTDGLQLLPTRFQHFLLESSEGLVIVEMLCGFVKNVVLLVLRDRQERDRGSCNLCCGRRVRWGGQMSCDKPEGKRTFPTNILPGYNVCIVWI